MRRLSSILAIAALCAATGLARDTAAEQAGRGGGRGAQAPQVVSPQVNADRTVTLQILAPSATEITVTGEILNGSAPQPM